MENTELLIVLLVILQYLIFIKIKKYNFVMGCVGISLLLLLISGFSVFVSSIVAFFLYAVKFEKTKRKTFDTIIKNTDSNSPDILMKYINSYGIINYPESWNKVRGVCFSINESSQVPTDKKRELRDFLTTKGLRLVGNDKNVIDNYKG